MKPRILTGLKFNARGMLIAPPGSTVTGVFVILGNDENSSKPNPDADWWFNVFSVVAPGSVILNPPNTQGDGHKYIDPPEA